MDFFSFFFVFLQACEEISFQSSSIYKAINHIQSCFLKVCVGVFVCVQHVHTVSCSFPSRLQVPGELHGRWGSMGLYCVCGLAGCASVSPFSELENWLVAHVHIWSLSLWSCSLAGELAAKPCCGNSCKAALPSFRRKEAPHRLWMSALVCTLRMICRDGLCFVEVSDQPESPTVHFHFFFFFSNAVLNYDT